MIPYNFCPYKGLQPYTEADRAFFFGREREQEIIASNLYAAPLTVLYGASGVGKSSVLLAGVLPQLRQTPRVAVLMFRTWQDPSFARVLKSEILRALTEAAHKNVQVNVALPFDEFLYQCTRMLRGSVFLIFDQFEEYFLYHADVGADSFDAQLARAVNRKDIDVNFLFSLREDGLSRLDRFKGRIPNLLNNLLRLEHLDYDATVSAVRKPLAEYNRRLAAEGSTPPPPEMPVLPPPVTMNIDDGLVEAVVQQVQTGHVTIGERGQGKVAVSHERVRVETPYLQLVMTRLWQEERAANVNTLRLATLERLGGSEKIVRTHLDAMMTRLTGEEQRIAAESFRYLVTPSGTKIAYTPTDLNSYVHAPLNAMLGTLQKLAGPDMRVLRAVAPEAGETDEVRYEIFHDVLGAPVLDWRERFLRRARTVRWSIAGASVFTILALIVFGLIFALGFVRDVNYKLAAAGTESVELNQKLNAALTQSADLSKKVLESAPANAEVIALRQTATAQAAQVAQALATPTPTPRPGAPRIEFFVAVPTAVVRGNPEARAILLSWSVQGQFTRIQIKSESFEQDALSANGKLTVAVDKTTRFNLSAANGESVNNASATVMVLEPTPSLTPTPRPILPTDTPEPTATPKPTPTPTLAPPTPTPAPQFRGQLVVPICIERCSERNHRQVRLVDLSASGAALAYRTIAAAATDPSFQPDGRRVLFRSLATSQTGRGEGLFFVDVTTNVEGRVTGSPDDKYPVFLAGGRVLFSSQRDQTREQRLYIVVRYGEDDQPRTVGPDPSTTMLRDARWPAVRGDGLIAYAGCVRGACGIWTTTENGYSQNNACCQIAKGGSDTAPDWSPDGRRVAFTSREEGGSDIFVVTADGSQRLKLTRGGGVNVAPTWSPDGQWVAYLSDRGGIWAVWVARADGTGQTQRLFELGAQVEDPINRRMDWVEN
jgi:hypothetical protein